MSAPQRVFRCPNDGCPMRLLAERRRRPWPPVRFYKCAFCVEIYAYVGENECEARPCGVFTYDFKTGGCTLTRRGASGVAGWETELARSLAAEVTLPRAVPRWTGAEE